MAIPMLKEHLIQFGGGEPVGSKPIAIVWRGNRRAWHLVRNG